MKVLRLILILLVWFLMTDRLTVYAQEVVPQEEPYQGSVVCLPPSKHYQVPVGDCLDYGPSAYMKRMLAAGVTFPIKPFVYNVLDQSYFALDVRYMKVRDDVRKRVPVYASMQDVENKSAVINYLETNFSYITYLDIVDSKYVLTSAGTWVSRGDVTPVAVPMTYRGLIFSSTPPTDFGWILLDTAPRTAPGYNNPEVPGEIYYTNQIMQVYEAVTIDGVEWNRVAENRWVEGRLLNRVMINTNPPEGVENGRWIEVNLAEQTISVYDNRRLVFATIVASGIEPLYTRPGLFSVYEKHATTPMSGSFEADRSDYYYLENVPWTLYFDKARALHGAYWRAKLGFAQSHGCVNLSVGDARWLYEWANEGDWVYVWDPTGLTPTDPAFYGEGGA
jgi:hypothetical protein